MAVEFVCAAVTKSQSSKNPSVSPLKYVEESKLFWIEKKQAEEKSC